MLNNIKSLPKIELHCHMDGSMSYDITKELADAIAKLF